MYLHLIVLIQTSNFFRIKFLESVLYQYLHYAPSATKIMNAASAPGEIKFIMNHQ
jgi:hypothetical protein